MIAPAIRRLTPAAVLFTVVASVPSLWANAADDVKPYSIKNGLVDQNTFTGYLHYEGTCYWCHGQDATGSTFAPSLVDRLKTLSHDEFENIVVNGGVVNGQSIGYGTSNVFVMPAFGTNPNVMCYLDDIYAYLRARSDGVIGRGRPAHEPVTQAVVDQGDACLGSAPSPTSPHVSTRP
jgi:mono/diheme cytochrome c family protein